MILAVMMTIVTAVSAMSYTQARNEALFLTDKMAYELDLSYQQYEAVYEINLDYYLCVTGRNLFGSYWSRRNADLRYVLTNWQYDRYIQLSYFYRPVQYTRNTFYFSIYSHYGRTQFYRDRPAGYISYRGGHNRVSGSHYRGRDYDKPINRHYKPRSTDMPPHTGNSSSGSGPGNRLSGNNGYTNGYSNNGHYQNNNGNNYSGNSGSSNHNMNRGNSGSNKGFGNSNSNRNSNSGNSSSGNSNRPQRNIDNGSSGSSSHSSGTSPRRSSSNSNKGTTSGTFGGKRQ